MSVPKSNFNIQLSPDDEKENVYHLNEDDDDFEDYEHIEGETEVKEEKEKKKENSNGKSKEETNGESAHPTIPTDIHAYCHRILPKGTLIDIAGLEYAKFTKVKAVGNLFSMIGVVHKREIEKGYLAYFDESYLYFIKDIEVDKINPNMRAIGNRFNLKLIQNAGFNNMNDDKWKVVMIFLKEYTANKIIQKELIFDQEQVEKFYSLMNSFFVKLGLQMSTSDGEEDNFEEEEEEA